ncbi:MAG: hypothetical protein [Caudoviricetes sp.]|nr:MAG: hypothetical protein [Caudoviricetes sp.]
MKIIKLPEKSKRSDKTNSFFRRDDYPEIVSIGWSVGNVAELDDIQLGDIIAVITADDRYRYYEPFKRNDYVFDYYYLANLNNSSVIYEANTLEELIAEVKLKIEDFINAKQIFVLKGTNVRARQNSGPHLVN